MPEQTSGGISRVILLYREENFDAALQTFVDTLGVADFGDVLIRPETGLRIAVSWETGIELIAPYGDRGYADVMRDHIEQHGEGFYGFVYRTPNLDEGEKRAARAGYPVVAERIDCLATNPAWRDRFASAIEGHLGPVAGVNVTLIQIDPVN